MEDNKRRRKMGVEVVPVLRTGKRTKERMTDKGDILNGLYATSENGLAHVPNIFS